MAGKLLQFQSGMTNKAAVTGPAASKCPKCCGFVVVGDVVSEPGDIVCLQCGWRGYATLPVEVLREARA